MSASSVAAHGRRCGTKSKTAERNPASACPAGSSSGCASRARSRSSRKSADGRARSAFDPLSTAKIEELIDELKTEYTIVIVTHNMQQAARISDFTAFMYLGELVEFDTTTQMFTTPHDKRTQDYITGDSARRLRRWYRQGQQQCQNISPRPSMTIQNLNRMVAEMGDLAERKSPIASRH